MNTYVCLLQNSHPERPRPGRRLGGLANLFSSRHRNSGSPSSSAREEINTGHENVSEISKTLSPSCDRPVSNNSQRPNKGTTVTSDATKPDTGSGTVKTVNPRVPNSSRFARNLSNTTEAINDANTNGDLLSDNEKSKRISSSKQSSGPVLTDKKRTALLHRDKEKRSLLGKRGSEDNEDKLLSANSQHERLQATSSSDSEVVVRRNCCSRREDKNPERTRYHDALSLR